MKKRDELDRATEMGVCGMPLEDSQDPCNWEVKLVEVGGKARRQLRCPDHV